MENRRKTELLMDLKRENIRKKYIAVLKAHEDEFLALLGNHNFRKSDGFEFEFDGLKYLVRLDKEKRAFRVSLYGDHNQVERFGFIVGTPKSVIYDERGRTEVYPVNRSIVILEYEARRLVG